MQIEAFQQELARSGVRLSRREVLRLVAAGGAALAATPLTRNLAAAQDAAPTPGGIWRMAIAGTPTVYPITAPAA